MALMPHQNPGNRTSAAKLSGGQKGGVVGVVGLLAATLLYTFIPKDEGTEYVAYQDVVKVWTICTGDTQNVRPGQVASDAECKQRLERQLIAHARPVISCTPMLDPVNDRTPTRGYQTYGAVDLAYNAGTEAYCRSSVARYFNAGQWVRGCNALRLWNKAGGRVIRGLDLRRRRAEQVCLTGLGPNWTPGNLSARLRGIK